MITFHGASDNKIKRFVIVSFETYRQQQFLPFQHTAAHQCPCKNKLGVHFSCYHQEQAHHCILALHRNVLEEKNEFFVTSWYVCMYVCVCVCVCVYMNVCMYVCMYIVHHTINIHSPPHFLRKASWNISVTDLAKSFLLHGKSFSCSLN